MKFFKIFLFSFIFFIPLTISSADEVEFPRVEVPQKKLFVGETLVYNIRYLKISLGVAKAEIKEITETTLELNRYDYVISENEQNEIITPNLGLLTEKQQSNEINNMKWFEYMRASESILQDKRFKEEKREYKIPSGIKEAAYWWANESHLKDDQFFKGIKYLINKNIISLPEKNLDNFDNSEPIPLWIKQDTRWWDDAGKITDDYFIETIENIIKNQMIENHDLK